MKDLDFFKERPWNEELEPHEIEVGEQYQYEESYHFAGTVTILEDLCDPDYEQGDWIGFRLRVDDVIFGVLPVGYEFNCGYREGYKHYGGWVLKPVGSMTEYVVVKNDKS